MVTGNVPETTPRHWTVRRWLPAVHRGAASSDPAGSFLRRSLEQLGCVLNGESLSPNVIEQLFRTRIRRRRLRGVRRRRSRFQPPCQHREVPSPPDPRTQQLLDNIQRAIPSIQKAAELFEQSSQELPAGSLDLAYDKQMEAIVELSNAWEWFLDVRRLIEVIYRDARVVRQATGNSQGDPQTLRQIAAAIAEAQQKNINRAHRLDRMLDFEMEQLAQAPPPSTPTPQATNAAPPAPDEQKKAERERLERAKPLLANALSKLVHAGQLLDEIATEPEPAPEPAEPVPAAQPAPEPEPNQNRAGIGFCRQYGG